MGTIGVWVLTQERQERWDVLSVMLAIFATAGFLRTGSLALCIPSNLEDPHWSTPSLASTLQPVQNE